MESKEVTKVLDPTVPSMDGDFCCWMITFLWKMVRWLIWWLLFKSIIVVRKYYGGVEDPKALSYSKWSLDHFELRKSADIICVICMYVGYSWVQKSGYQFGHPVQASSHRCEFSRFTSWISSSYKLPCWCNSEIKGIRIQTTSWSFTTYLCFSAPGHIMSSFTRFFPSLGPATSHRNDFLEVAYRPEVPIPKSASFKESIEGCLDGVGVVHPKGSLLASRFQMQVLKNWLMLNL